MNEKEKEKTLTDIKEEKDVNVNSLIKLKPLENNEAGKNKSKLTLKQNIPVEIKRNIPGHRKNISVLVINNKF